MNRVKMLQKIVLSTLILTITFTSVEVINRHNAKNGLTCLYPIKYENIQDLKKDAIVDVIILGKVEAANPYKDYTTAKLGYLITTDYTIKVEQAIKGGKKGQVQVHQTGGKLGDEYLRKPDEPEMKIGDRAVLFLHEFSDGSYYIVGGPQGKYLVIDNHVFNSAELSQYRDVRRLGENLKTRGIELDDFLNQLS